MTEIGARLGGSDPSLHDRKRQDTPMARPDGEEYATYDSDCE